MTAARSIGHSTLAGDQTTHPFLWDGHQMIDLETLGGDNGSAIQINNAGQVAGEADLPGSHVHHAFLWQNGKMTDLGTVDGDSCSNAFGLNSQGQVRRRFFRDGSGQLRRRRGMLFCGKLLDPQWT